MSAEDLEKYETEMELSLYRPARFVKQVRVITFKDVNIEEVEKPELRLPE